LDGYEGRHVISLPRHLPGIANDCVPASVAMVCMYWRVKRPDLLWNLPKDAKASEWDEFHEEARRRVREPGISEGILSQYLQELNIPLAAQYKQLFGLESMFSMLNSEVPPIPVFDRSYMFLGTPSYGHAGVVVDRTRELIVLIDPANSPKFLAEYSIRQFSESWKRRNNLTILIYPEDVTPSFIEVPSKTRTLPEYFPGG
jgi:hypothetical protein